MRELFDTKPVDVVRDAMEPSPTNPNSELDPLNLMGDQIKFGGKQSALPGTFPDAEGLLPMKPLEIAANTPEIKIIKLPTVMPSVKIMKEIEDWSGVVGGGHNGAGYDPDATYPTY